MVFYFSGTGNSYYTAKKIAENLNEELISIPDILKNKKYNIEIRNNEKVGFVFPAYYFGIPVIIREFFKKVNFKYSNISYVYVIFTCESDIGGADIQIKRQLKKQGLKVNYIYQLPMPNNCAIFYDLPSDEFQMKKLKNAETLIENLISNIRNEITGGYFSNLNLRFVSNISYPLYYFGRKTKKFQVNEKCVNCGLCEKICPIGVIKIENGKPKWIKKKCVYCLACVNRCPQMAIQLGIGYKNKKRYINPIYKM